MISRSIFLLSICFERADQRFERTLRVAFQNDAQKFLAVRPLRADFPAWRVAERVNLSARFVSQALFAQGFRRALGFHDEKFIAGIRQTGETQHLHRRRGPGFLDRLAAIVHERFHFAAVIAADERIADFQRAHLHDDGGGRTAAGFHLRFDHGAARRGGGRRFQFHHFGLQRHHLEQLIDPVPFVAETGHDDRFAAPIFRRQVLFLELLLHPVDVRRRQDRSC